MSESDGASQIKSKYEYKEVKLSTVLEAWGNEYKPRDAAKKFAGPPSWIIDPFKARAVFRLVFDGDGGCIYADSKLEDILKWYATANIKAAEGDELIQTNWFVDPVVGVVIFELLVVKS